MPANLPGTPNNILSRSINVYALPYELLSSLSVRSIQDATVEQGQDEEPAASSSKPLAGLTAPVSRSANASGTLSCQACPRVSFESVEEQRQHFKSDWHRYNVKAKLTGRAVNAEEWENMVEGVSSISGSASSSSGSSANSQSKVSRLLRKATIKPSSDLANGIDSDEEAEIADRQRRAHLRSAVVWFSPTSSIPSLGIPEDTQFGIYRALFPHFDTAADYLGELRRMQLDKQKVVPGKEDEERRITLLMVAGGHFAGMVISLSPRGKSDRIEVKGAGEVKVLQHKTFHRYTTRKKQGGSQALNDNAKSKAVSAGAMLRRYGEQALQEEIRQLMTDWEEDLALSERIFVRASTHGKKSFWGYEGAVLDKADPRIRVFPFPTRRPTIGEVLRSYHELTRVKVSHLSAAALQAQDAAYIASLQPKRTIPKPAPTTAPVSTPVVPVKSAEELAKEDRQRRLGDMIKKGRLEALKPFWERYRDEFDVSALGLAAAATQEEVIRWFLVDAKLDPAAPILASGGAGASTTTTSGLDEAIEANGEDSVNGPKQSRRMAYDMCTTKAARNIFRRVRYEHPDLYDWNAAHVPVGLSEEMEEKQDSKKAERRKGLREKMRERGKARAETDDGSSEVDGQVEIKQANGPASGGGGASGNQKLGGRDTGGLAGMSDEMRMRIERERRARAAEERFKKLAGK